MTETGRSDPFTDVISLVSGPITAVVVGGSGRYLGGWGVATITPTRDDGVSRLVVRLGRRH